MKPESIKEMQDAIAVLNYTMTDLSNAKEDIKGVIEKLNAIVFMETPKVKGKFDLYDIASKDETRPVMQGIYHDNGFKVASDEHVLVAVKSDYDEALEHHVIGRDGRDILGKYPRWNVILPTDNEDTRTWEIDTAKVYDLLRAQKAEKKASGRRYALYAAVRIGDAYFKAEWLANVCRFMDHFGIKTIKTFGPRRAARVDAPDGSVAIIMPTGAINAWVGKDGWYTSTDRHPWEVWDDEENYKFHRLVLA